MRTTLLNIIAAAVALGGCTYATQEEEPVVAAETSTVRPSDSGYGVLNYCVWSGGSNWCQDAFSKKWCTNATSGSGWDQTGCTWKGWDSTGTQFCGTNYPGYEAGWQWDTQAHYHCD